MVMLLTGVRRADRPGQRPRPVRGPGTAPAATLAQLADLRVRISLTCGPRSYQPPAVPVGDRGWLHNGARGGRAPPERGSSLGELGIIRQYSYWSDRQVKDVVADNPINLERRWRLTLKTPTLGLAPLAEFAEERRTPQRHEIALKVERAIGKLAVEDFVTPPSARFAKGSGRVTIAAYTRWHAKKKSERKGIIAHTRTVSSDGCRVEVCLLGSLKHCTDYLPASEVEAPMWASSSTWAIEEFIANEGDKPAPIYDDDQAIAVEVLRVFNNEGMTGMYVFKPLASAEWFANVYHNVVLDKERWDLRWGGDLPEPVDRIVIGAPLWIRSNG